jgi:hypothetical protein
MTKVLCAPAQNWDRVLRQHMVDSQVPTCASPAKPTSTWHEPGSGTVAPAGHTFTRSPVHTLELPANLTSNPINLKSISHQKHQASINQSKCASPIKIKIKTTTRHISGS